MLKRFRDGEAGLPAHLDDYAFMVWGFLELYEHMFDPEYLRRAIELNSLMLKEFWDDQSGGLFFTAENQSDLLVRNTEIYDGAVPSGNSVAAFNLLRIGRLTSNPDLEEKARAIGAAVSKQVNLAPLGYTQLLAGLLFAKGPTYEVVITGERDAEDTKAMISVLRRGYYPNKVSLFRPAADQELSIVKLAPYTEFQTPIDGKATAYVCKDYTCSAPTTDIDEMLNLLEAKQ